jgi:general stress protein CsbA
LYFIINGAFNDLIDSLIIFNYDYATHLHTDFNLSKWWCYSFWLKHSRIFFPSIMILWFIGIRKSSKHKSKPVMMGAVSALSMALFSVFSVSIQRKYYAYHWIVAMPFFVLCAGYGVAELMPRRRNLLFIGVSAIVLSAFLFAPSWKLNQQGTYKTYTYSFWNYFLGNCSREEFLKPLQNPFGSCYSDQEKIGKMIKQLAKPGDRMSVRSYDTPIYAVSGLRSPAKYFWDLPHLWDTSFSWYSKHIGERDIENRSVFPRFVVVQEYSERDMSHLLEQGYLIIGYFPPSVIFEK